MQPLEEGECLPLAADYRSSPSKQSATKFNRGTGGCNEHSPLHVKIQLYKSFFKGRADVYATRWEAKDGRSGYLPACAHEWDRPICQKPKIKCSECQHRTLLPLTDQVIETHLQGQHIVGLYSIQTDESCSFLAVGTATRRILVFYGQRNTLLVQPYKSDDSVFSCVFQVKQRRL